LINTGYFHGYKGYRFFKISSTHLPFSSYAEVYATIQYDSALKNLMYGKVMFIETAVKNITLEGILVNAQSEILQDIFEKVVSGYNNAPVGFKAEQRKKLQQNKLNLQNKIQSYLAKAYGKNNPQITHFYNKVGTAGVPIWAILEIIMMGDLGFLLSCLTFEVRDDISKRLGLNLASDTNRQLVYKYLYALKDLRNAIAHNSVVFDTRFSKIDASPAMKQCLMTEIRLPYINFKTIGDYVILICYYLKLLKVPKTEIRAFVRTFEQITYKYEEAVNQEVAAIVIHPDVKSRMKALEEYI